MPTASLIKTPILATLYRAVEDRKLRLDDRTVYREEHRSLGSGVLSKMSFGVEMTVRDAAMLMMTISDNSATNMCIDLVGLDAINALMRVARLPVDADLPAARRPVSRPRSAQDERQLGRRHLPPVHDDRASRVCVGRGVGGHAAHHAAQRLPSRAIARAAVERDEHARRRSEASHGWPRRAVRSSTACAPAGPSSRVRQVRSCWRRSARAARPQALAAATRATSRSAGLAKPPGTRWPPELTSVVLQPRL